MASPSPVVYTGTVIELVPDLQLAHVRTADGQLLAINARTPGLTFAEVLAGDVVRMTIDQVEHRVLLAELVERRPSVLATVVATIPEFEQALARDADDFQYAVTPHSAGTPWHQLAVGESVRLWVTPPPVRVERAERL